MKLKSLKLKNFAKFTDFEIEYDDKVTRLVGMNGSGKTTVGLTGPWAAMKGISEKSGKGQLVGERFRFIGTEGPTADIELTLIDEVKCAEIKVKNHITKTSNQIKFEAPDDYVVDESWLKNLLSVSFMSAKNFTEIDGKKQASLLGIDTSLHDSEIENLKSEYTLLNRDFKNLGCRDYVEKVESVSVSKLIEEKDKVDVHNLSVSANERSISVYEDNIYQVNSQIDNLKSEISKLFQENKLALKSLEECKEKRKTLIINDSFEIKKQIECAEETNKMALQYDEHVKWEKAIDESKILISKNKEKQKNWMKSRLDYIQSFDFGMRGVSVDEKGSLLIGGKPVRSPYFSKGELELIVAKLHASRDPSFKVRFLDDFELLDEDNQKIIIDSLLASGFQIIIAEVGKCKKGANSILLSECALSSDEK